MITPVVTESTTVGLRTTKVRKLQRIKKTSRAPDAAAPAELSVTNPNQRQSMPSPGVVATRQVFQESRPAVAFATASDFDAFTASAGATISAPPRPLSQEDIHGDEDMSVEEASELLDQLLFSPPSVELTTCSGLQGDTDQEMVRIQPTLRNTAARQSAKVRSARKTSAASADEDEDSDVVLVDTISPVAALRQSVPMQPETHRANVAPTQQHIAAQQAVSTQQPMQAVAPAPMMIPVPIPMPQWIPASAVQQSSTDVDQLPAVDSEKTAVEKSRLPDPESVAKPTTVSAVSRENLELDTANAADAPAADTGRQQERVQVLRRFHKLVEQAKVDLRPLQEPLVGKAPRGLQNNIGKLHAMAPAKFDDVVAQLNLIAKTQSPFALQTFRDYIDSRQVRYRQAATDGLSGIVAPGAAIALLDRLQDDVAAVASSALAGIVRMGFAETVPVLVALGRVDGRSRVQMRDELCELTTEVQERLVGSLKDAVKAKGDPAAAAFAVSLLSYIKGGELLKMYMSLTRHPAAPIRVAAIEALVQTEEKQIVRFLNGGIKDPDPRVRGAAAVGMAKISSPKSESLLIAALGDEQASVRRIAAQTLVDFESKAVAGAASKALNSETDPGVVEILLEIVGRGGTDDALITLQKYLESDDRELQHRAMATLRRLKNPKSAKLVAPFLKSDHHETRRLAVETVGLLKHNSVLPQLRDMLRSDPEEQIRAAVARSLGDLKDTAAVSLLEESLHDGRTVRCQAVIALGSIGLKESVPALVAQLRDTAAEVRCHACNALGQIGDLPDPEPLQNLLEDKEAMVRRGAEAALNKMGHKVGQAKLARRLRKMTAFMMPSVVAGAIPGGTAMIIAVVVLSVVGIGYKAMDTVSVAGEAAFTISDVHAIAVNHDGSQVSVARKYNVLEVWDTTSGELTAQFQADAGAVGILYRQNGNALILAGPKSFEMDTTRVASEGKQALAVAGLNNLSTHRVASTPDGTKAVLCTSAGKMTLVDMTSQKQTLTFQVKDFGARDSITISPDATLAFIGSSGGLLKVYSLEDGKPLGRLDIGMRIDSPGAGITALMMDRSGSMIAVGTSSGSVVVVDTNKMEVLGKPYSGTGSIIGLAFQGDSKRLSVVTSQRELITCNEDFSSGKKLTTSMSELPERVAFSSDGNVAAFFFAESDEFCVVDLVSDKVLAVYPKRG